jgi:hypothetical protein
MIVGGMAITVGGFTGEVLGGAATTTGIGAAVGVPAMVVSTTLVVGGAGNVAAGIRGLMTTGSGTSNSSNAASAAKQDVNWSWKSTKTFGHTFKTHGAGAKNFQRLLDRTRTPGQSPTQGQWLDNQKAADFLRGIKVDGPATVQIPRGLGQVIHADGTVTAAQWARVAPNPDGGFISAFPVAP